MIVMIVFICLSIVFAIVTAIYINMKKTYNNKILYKTDKDKDKRKDKKRDSRKQLRDILNIKIKNEIICVNNRFSCILKLGSIDYNMLSDNEQETIENVLMQTAISLDSPIQFFTTTENIDTTEIIKTIKENKTNNSEINKCKEKLIRFLYDLMENGNISMVKSYAIISYDGLYENSLDELNRRALNFKSNLLRAKIQCEILNEDEIYSLIYRELNKNSSIVKLNLNGGEKLYVSKKEKNKK